VEELGQRAHSRLEADEEREFVVPDIAPRALV
jgi:hypothetical protein